MHSGLDCTEGRLLDCAVALTSEAPARDVCEALGVSRATLYRVLAASETDAASCNSGLDPDQFSGLDPEHRSPRALAPEEQEAVLDLLHSEPFVDKTPPQIYTALLDQGIYLASISTMYRLLRQRKEVRERRNQLTHPVYARPELMAGRPNELWSWDITKLRGPLRGIYYCLYVILDVFSRYIVGWTIQTCESQDIAKELIEQSCEKQEIMEGQLNIHADRGPAMKSKTVAELMVILGVTKSHSRPHVSNDNPYSEAQFKTMKYRPDYPDRFASLEEARTFCEEFVQWYNTEHYHSGIAMVTPEDLHYGRAPQIIEARARVLDKAYQAHPERFVRRQPVPQPVPTTVWINPPLARSGDHNGTN